MYLCLRSNAKVLDLFFQEAMIDRFYHSVVKYSMKYENLYEFFVGNMIIIYFIFHNYIYKILSKRQ